MIDLSTLPKPLSYYTPNTIPEHIRKDPYYHTLYESAIFKNKQHQELSQEEWVIIFNPPIKVMEVQLQDVRHLPTGRILKLQVPTKPTPQWLSVYEPLT